MNSSKPIKFGIYQRKSGRFQVFFQHEGKQIHLQKGFTGKPLNSRLDCSTLIAYLRHRGYRPEEWGRGEQPYQFSHAVGVWIKSSNASPEWVQHKTQIASKFFLPFFKKQDIRQIKTIHIQEFYASLLEKGYSSRYCSTLIGQLKAFFRFNSKSLTELPDFPRVQIQEGVPKWLSEEDQNKLFQHIPKVDLPIFSFLKYYGCRTNEGGGLLKKNVFLDHDPAYFVVATVLKRNGEIRETTKTKRVRILPIPSELRWIFESRDTSPFVFSKGKVGPYTNRRLNLIWNRANKLAGVPLVNLYNGTRHSFGFQKLNRGYSIEEIRVVLGHTSSVMTRRYAQYDLKSLTGIITGNGAVIENKEPKLLEHKGKGENGKKLSPRPF
jgi:integrase